MRIATGGGEDSRQPNASAAAQAGKLGGTARAKKLTAERRSEIARVSRKALEFRKLARLKNFSGNIFLDFWSIDMAISDQGGSVTDMPDRTMEQTMEALGDDLLDAFDQIARKAHERYRSYRPEDLIELDPRAQAACTYCHMLADCERRFGDMPGVRMLDIRGQKLWLFEHADAVIRLKKIDEDGRSRNYPTKQAKDFDAGADLPGLPMPPVRLTAGYLLDQTASVFVRTQVARPVGREAMWCGAIVPREQRKVGERLWVNVTRQTRL